MVFENFIQENYSEKVAKGYIKDYIDFKNFLSQNNIKVVEMTEINVREYIQFLRENGKSQSTIGKKLTLVRKYLKWLRQNNKMQHNPMDNIEQPKIAAEKRVVNADEKKVLKELVAESGNIRDIVILDLLINDGVKPSEMIKITANDCKLEEGLLYLDSKRAVTLSEETAAHIKELIGDSHNSFILTNQHGHPLKESGIYYVIKKMMDAVSLSDVKPIHLLKSN